MEQAEINFITICTMLIPGVYLFKIYKYILKADNKIQRYFRNFLYFIGTVGICYSVIRTFDKMSIAISIAAIAPSIHWYLFKIYLKRFIRKNGKEPVDVFLNFSSGLSKDRVFAVSVWLGSIFGTFLILGWFLYPSK